VILFLVVGFARIFVLHLVSGAACCLESVETEKPLWAGQLKRRGFYFEGLVDSDDVETILERRRRDTVTSYGRRTSIKVTHTADDGTGDKQNLQVLLHIHISFKQSVF